MNYFFSFFRSIAMTLSVLASPQVMHDYVGVNDAIVVVNNLSTDNWTCIEAMIRKDPLGSYRPLGQRVWYRAQVYGFWYFDHLEAATTYEVLIRACDATTGRYSAWVPMSFTTWP